MTQSHTFAALIGLSTTTHNLLSFNISEISSNNWEKLSLSPDKHLWTFSLTLVLFKFMDVRSHGRRITLALGAIHSTKIPTGPTGKSGPPQKVDPFFRNFSGLTEPIHWVLDRNFRKFWLNGSRPFCFHTRKKKRRLGLGQSSPAILLSPNSFDS